MDVSLPFELKVFIGIKQMSGQPCLRPDCRREKRQREELENELESERTRIGCLEEEVEEGRKEKRDLKRDVRKLEYQVSSLSTRVDELKRHKERADTNETKLLARQAMCAIDKLVRLRWYNSYLQSCESGLTLGDILNARDKAQLSSDELSRLALIEAELKITDDFIAGYRRVKKYGTAVAHPDLQSIGHAKQAIEAIVGTAIAFETALSMVEF